MKIVDFFKSRFRRTAVHHEPQEAESVNPLSAGNLSLHAVVVSDTTKPGNTSRVVDLHLRLAALRGDSAEVARLIPISDPKADDSIALRWAAECGHARCVELLIPVSDPKADDSIALLWAAFLRHTRCVELLVPVSGPIANNKVLTFAARDGLHELVRLLIPVSDPKANNSEALAQAARCGHIRCVELLVPVSDICEAVGNDVLFRHEAAAELIWTVQQRQRIEQAIAQDSPPTIEEPAKRRKI